MKDGRHRIQSESGFIKKRDSENHAAMLALKKIKNYGYLDDYLFPKIGQWIVEKKY